MAKQELLNLLAAFLGALIGQIICTVIAKLHKRRIDQACKWFLEETADLARQNILLKEENEALKLQASERDEVTR